MRCLGGFKPFLVFSIVFLILFLIGSTFCQARERIIIFPFENFTAEASAPALVMNVLKESLQKRGVEIVDESDTNRFMQKERVRSTANMPKEVLLKAKKELSADYVLLGTIHNFYASENPQAGISARLIEPESGEIVWADYSSHAGEDFVKLLGLGAIKDIDRLVQRVVERLLGSFNSVRIKEKESTYRIAVIPFKNNGKRAGAGSIVAHMFVNELYKSDKFVPVDYGFVRNATVFLRIWPSGEIDYLTIDALSGYLNIDAILIGTVEEYPDRENEMVKPEVEISARLIDARKKRVIWSNSMRMDRDSDIYIFDWGRITTIDKIAHKVASKLVKEMERARWH